MPGSVETIVSDPWGRRMACVVLAALLAVAGAHADEPAPVAIRVLVSGAEPETGRIFADLFASAEGFMRDSAGNAVAAVDGQGAALLDLGAHPPGDYAVMVFYDRNGNDKLDTNFLGIPREKVGASNNARGRFGPPKWRDARFRVEADTTLEIRLASARD